MGFVTRVACWLGRRRQRREGPTPRPLKRLHFEALEERTLLDAALPELVVDSELYAPSSLLVAFREGAAPADLLPEGATLGEAFPLVPGLYEVELGGALTVEGALAAFRANPFVEFAEPDYEVHVDFIPNDTFFGSLWGLHNTGQSGGRVDADIDAPEAWDTTLGTKSVIVAVIDTGVDYNHPDLAANIWTNADEIPGNFRDDDLNGYVDDVHGYDFYSNDGNPLDGNGHGTHVAGTIGAVANNGRGVAGVNPNVQIMALQFLSPFGSGFTSDAVRALNYAVANGASISNNSWGGGGFSTSLFNAIANARAQGHIFVAAAGNDGSNNDVSPHYPSNYNLDNVVAVAATDRNDNRASFSNYGATSVDLGAPGVSILSTYPGNRYATFSGTSMATPHVAGALALIRDLHPEYTYLEAINRLLSSVDPLSSLSGLTVSGGRLNVANALGPAVPRISIDDVSVVEGNSGTIDALFTVTLSSSSSSTVTVDYATASGTATAGSDYVAGSGTVTFAPGQTSRTVAVTVNGDTTVEPNETFFVNLTNPVGATVQDGQGVGTIQNDDLPKISIDDVSVTEGNSGTVDAVFTVTLSTAGPATITVSYATADGTATAGSDYASVNGMLSFAPGQTSKTVTVVVNGDTTVEPNEVFFVTLSNPVGATLLDDQGLGTILNDDVLSLSINDVSVTEGDSGTVDAVFTVTLSQAGSETVTVDYATADDTAAGGSDYATAGGTLTFAPGDTSKTVAVAVNGDTTPEVNETFFVNLSNAVGATLADDQGLGTIRDDDVPSVSIDDVTVTEGNSGTADAVFTVTLSSATVINVTVEYATANGTATAGSDYATASGTLTFAPGDTSKTVAVAVNGDTAPEPNETFFVNLSNAVGATLLDDQGRGTIRNDDVPSLSINDVSVLEGNSGTIDAVFTVTLSGAISEAVTVDYGTADDTATAGSDYGTAGGTLTFAAGQTSKTVAVAVNGDTEVEPNETFFVNLSNASGATILDGQGLGTIQNDDSDASLQIDDAAVIEGNSGTVNLVFTVSLSGPAGAAVSVDYATGPAPGSTSDQATPGTDYDSISGQLTIPAGETSRTIAVTVRGDTTVEPHERFAVNLSNAVGAAIADAQGVGTIRNDDTTISINDVKIVEGNSDLRAAEFKVTLAQPSAMTVSVRFATADVNAVQRSDYLATSGTLVFQPDEIEKSINVWIVGDILLELDEIFFVQLSTPTNATIADALGIGTILNDDGSLFPRDSGGGFLLPARRRR